MSYFDFFCNNKSNEKPKDAEAEAIHGTCRSMCPEEEVVIREKARMVHILEVSRSGEKQLIKCYSRSAADSVVAVPRLLRPRDVLQSTVEHLLFVVTKRTDVKVSVIYDFLNDRLRAVRQDMTIQRLSAQDTVALLEPMIRFHVYYGYVLCKHPVKVYDPVLNKKYLLECLKWFLGCYASIDRADGPDWGNTMRHLDYFNALHIEDAPREPMTFLKCDRELMESLYILCNLGDDHPISRYWTLSKKLKSNPSINLAYKIAVANMRGNFVQVCRQLDNLCPLTYCALCLHLPELQRKALQVVSSAYNSKQLSVPLGALRGWLRLRGEAEAARLCRHYGLRAGPGAGAGAGAGAVRLLRADFRADAPLHEPIEPFLLEKEKDLSIDNIFTYITRK